MLELRKVLSNADDQRLSVPNKLWIPKLGHILSKYGPRAPRFVHWIHKQRQPKLVDMLVGGTQLSRSPQTQTQM